MSEYTGKDVSYYLVEIAAPKRLDPYTAECEDIIEALNMTFAEGCAFKAIWRKCAARTLGLAKAGYKGGLYDAEKTQYYGARMVAVEHRAAKQLSMPRQEGETIIVHTPEQREDIYAKFNARTVAPVTFHERVAEIDEVIRRAAALGAAYKQPFCAECGYPTDDAGTHYAACSRLTAPEEYKAEAQVAFEEAAAEPAAAMDDDSERMQAIGQNGEMAEEVYAAVDAADPFAGAPGWAKYKAQDSDGCWHWYRDMPILDDGAWDMCEGNRFEDCGAGKPNRNWRDTLIART